MAYRYLYLLLLLVEKKVLRPKAAIYSIPSKLPYHGGTHVRSAKVDIKTSCECRTMSEDDVDVVRRMDVRMKR